MVKPPTPSNVIRDKAQMDKLYGIGDGERQDLIDWIGTLEVPKALQKTLAKGTDLDAVADAFCPNCNASVKVRYPNYAAMASFIKLLFEYKLSKPDVKRELHITGRVVHELDSLSDAELELVAEGEWVPQLLPPAA